MPAGSKNSPETDCLANQNDTKSSLSDFFTSTVAQRQPAHSLHRQRSHIGHSRPAAATDSRTRRVRDEFVGRRYCQFRPWLDAQRPDGGVPSMHRSPPDGAWNAGEDCLGTGCVSFHTHANGNRVFQLSPKALPRKALTENPHPPL